MQPKEKAVQLQQINYNALPKQLLLNAKIEKINKYDFFILLVLVVADRLPTTRVLFSFQFQSDV